MKRFPLKPAQAAVEAHAPLHLEQGLLRQASHLRGHHYSLFMPLHYERNYAYPLIVWLHGPGDDERQLQRIMPLVSMRNFVSIGPRGTRPYTASESGHTWPEPDEDLSDTEERVFDCLDFACQRLSISARRIFLAGYQCGGTLAFRIGLKYPHRFAGILSLGGPFPTGNTPLVNYDQVRLLPLFIAQGRRSVLYPAETTCHELRLFHAAGMHVTLRQYPGGDELHAQMLHDMNVWIMELVTGIPTTPTESLSP
jgi:phospholipase/carboxylesterase